MSGLEIMRLLPNQIDYLRAFKSFAEDGHFQAFSVAPEANLGVGNDMGSLPSRNRRQLNAHEVFDYDVPVMFLMVFAFIEAWNQLGLGIVTISFSDWFFENGHAHTPDYPAWQAGLAPGNTEQFIGRTRTMLSTFAQAHLTHPQLDSYNYLLIRNLNDSLPPNYRHPVIRRDGAGPVAAVAAPAPPTYFAPGIDHPFATIGVTVDEFNRIVRIHNGMIDQLCARDVSFVSLDFNQIQFSKLPASAFVVSEYWRTSAETLRNRSQQYRAELSSTSSSQISTTYTAQMTQFFPSGHYEPLQFSLPGRPGCNNYIRRSRSFSNILSEQGRGFPHFFQELYVINATIRNRFVVYPYFRKYGISTIPRQQTFWNTQVIGLIPTKGKPKTTKKPEKEETRENIVTEEEDVEPAAQ
jgi:hypothetical protein